MDYQIAVLVGSIRKDSFNRKLAQAMIGLAPSEFTFTFLSIHDLPLYNQDDDADPAETVIRLKSIVTASQGVLLVTPEYNRSIPGVLKNALDHGSRPYGKSVWAKKPAGVIGTSQGMTGTSLAQQHLRNIIAYLDMPTMGQPEGFIQMKEGFFDSTGQIAEASRGFIQRWMESYVDWVKKHN